ncbi:MAG TPA: hypothetical protein VJA63_01780 [Candidatus Paceibacterota bacterium]
MPNITPEKARERFDALPEYLKEVLFSEKSTDVVWGLGESNHLTEERTKKIADLTGAVILGFVHPEDLAKEFQKEVNLPAQVASSIAEEINKKILAPIIEEVKSLYHWGGVRPATGSTPTAPTAPAPQAVPVEVQQVQQTLKPIFREEPNREELPQAPFILHEEEGPERVESRGGTPSLARPYFFEEDRGPNPTEQKPISARLEVDEETTAYPYSVAEKKPPKVGKTGEPQIRVVHYTGPSTQVGPFEPTEPEEPLDDSPRFAGEAGARGKPEDKPPIHPNNVINLKDLPQ